MSAPFAAVSTPPTVAGCHCRVGGDLSLVFYSANRLGNGEQTGTDRSRHDRQEQTGADTGDGSRLQQTGADSSRKEQTAADSSRHGRQEQTRQTGADTTERGRQEQTGADTTDVCPAGERWLFLRRSSVRLRRRGGEAQMLPMLPTHDAHRTPRSLQICRFLW